jgi:hypothetical protein
MRGVRVVVGLGGAIAVLGAGTAHAATVIGSDLSVAPSVGTARGNFTNDTVARGAVGPSAPSAGVIVEIRIRRGATGADPGDYAYRILSGTPPNLTARPATVSGANEYLTFPANSPAAVDSFVPRDGQGSPRGVPIAAGERIATFTEFDSGIGPPSEAPLIDEAVGSVLAGPVSLDHFTGPQPYFGVPNRNRLVQAIIEPDADRDGYGDETQDRCTTDATTHGTCDLTGPTPKISKGPKKETESRKATFRFTSDDPGATFRCRLDRKSFTDCTSPERYRKLKAGKHRFRVQATDSKGNVGPIDSLRWRVVD